MTKEADGMLTLMIVGSPLMPRNRHPGPVASRH